MYRVNRWLMDFESVIKLASILAGVQVLGLAPALVLLMNKGFNVKEEA